jgi:hypothetical protein
MNRRELLRFTPLVSLAIPGVARATKGPQRPAEPSPWVEKVCERQLHYWTRSSEYIPIGEPCGTRYKHLRGTMAICPKCNWTMPSPGEDVVGIEVK